MTQKPLTLMKWLGVSLVTLLFAACSGDSTMKALLEQVPADVDYVVVGKSTDVLESLGGSVEDKSKIVLPKNIADELPASAEKALDEANEKLKDMGVDISGIAVFGTFENSNPTVVVAIDDEDKFDKYIRDEYDGSRYTDDDNDFVIYSTGEEAGHHVAVYDGYAYIFNNYEENKEARRTARKLFNSIDEDGDFASTDFADYIVDSNVFGAAVKFPREMRDMMTQAGVPSSVAKLYSGAVLMRGAVNGDEVTVDVKVVDKEGNDIDTDALKELYDFNARISSDALAYLGANEQAVFACALKNFKWDKYLEPLLNSSYMSRDDAAVVSVVKGFLNKLDGTIAIGFGLNKGLESIAAMSANNAEIANQLSCTLVLETKDGKAKTVLNDFKSFLNQNHATYNNTSDGLSIDINETTKIYAKAEGNMLVFANHTIEKKNACPAVKALNFADYISAGVIAFAKSNPLMKDLGLDNDVLFTCTSDVEKMECTLKLKVSGSAGVLANITQMVLGVVSRATQIQNKFTEYSSQYAPSYTDYYDPYAVADSTYVEDEVPPEPDEYFPE